MPPEALGTELGTELGSESLGSRIGFTPNLACWSIGTKYGFFGTR